MERLDGQIGKIVPRFVKHATKIEHAAIDLGITVELRSNSFEDEACVNRKRLEHALYHLKRVGTLVNGIVGLTLGYTLAYKCPT